MNVFAKYEHTLAVLVISCPCGFNSGCGRRLSSPLHYVHVDNHAAAHRFDGEDSKHKTMPLHITRQSIETWAMGVETGILCSCTSPARKSEILAKVWSGRRMYLNNIESWTNINICSRVRTRIHHFEFVVCHSPLIMRMSALVDDCTACYQCKMHF